MKKITYLLALIGAAGAMVLAATPVSAAGSGSGGNGVSVITPVPGGGSTTSGTLSSFAGSVGQTVINVILAISTVIAIIFLIYSGVQYVTAGGDPEKAKKARSGIVNAVIGIVVIVAAYAIVNFAVTLGGAASNTLNNSSNVSN